MSIQFNVNTIVLSLSFFFFRPPGFRTNVINIIFLTSERFNRNSMQERRKKGKYGEGVYFSSFIIWDRQKCIIYLILWQKYFFLCISLLRIIIMKNIRAFFYTDASRWIYGKNLWKDLNTFPYVLLELNLDFFFFIKILIQLNLLISQEEYIYVYIITCSYVIFNKYLIQKSKTRKKTAEQSFYLKFRKTTISTILEMDRYH